MSADAVSPRPGPRRGPRWGLIASLALNVILIVAIIVGLIGLVRAGERRAGGPLAPHTMVRIVTPETRPALEAVIAENAADYRATRRALRQARGDIVRAFRAEPYDQARFEAALARLETAEAAFNAVRRRAIGEASAVLSPKDRERVMERMRERREGRRGRGPED